MELLFYADPLETFNLKKDSTFAMMQEAVRRGHQIYACCPRDLAWLRGDVSVCACHITLTGMDGLGWFDVLGTEDRGLETFDAVIIRKDPPFDIGYLNSTYLLDLSEKKGARIFNRPDALRRHNEKLTIAQFPEFTVPTLVSADENRLRSFHTKYRDIILKPLNAMGGTGVFRVGDDGLNLGSIIETLTGNGSNAVMAQQYISDIVDGDKRILLVNGQVVPFALARVPKKGEVRGNLAAGGMGRAQPLSERDWQIAKTLAPILADRGLFLVGLDVIGDWLTEVNVTSPTCFREIEQQTGFNVAGLFMDELEKTV